MSPLAVRLPELIGVTILHSLWQITLLWILLLAVLRLCPRASSAVRYTLAISTLAMAVLATAATAVYEWQSHTISEEIFTLSPTPALPMQTAFMAVKQNVLPTVADALNASIPLLSWFWFAGLVVMGARFGGSLFYLRTLRAPENTTKISPVWEQMLNRLSNAQGVSRHVAIAASGRISSPLTLGFLSPVILLPAGLLSGFSTEQIEAVLVHELYHIKRRDYIVNICQALVEVILFYHPAIWQINNIIREERENCCDDQTVAFCGDAISYARALTEIQEINTIAKPSLAISVMGSSRHFTHRIQRLFDIYPDPAQARSKGIFALGFLLVYLCLLVASTDISIAQPAKSKIAPPASRVGSYSAISKITADSDSVNKSRSEPENNKAVALRPAPLTAGVKAPSTDMQRADTTSNDRSLNKCLQKVTQLLEMASFYGFSGESTGFSTFAAEQLLQRVSSARYPANAPVSLQPAWMTKAGSLSDHSTAGSDDTISEEPTVGATFEKTNSIDGVQVFPNATNGRLNISFTPAQDDSHVKIILVDSNGTVLKAITDAPYDAVPAALQIDVGGYKKGIYFLQVDINGARSQHRIVVE